MTEDEYILVTNKTAVTIAIASLREVLTGDKAWGVDEELLDSAGIALSKIQTDLFKKIEIMDIET